MSGRRTRRGRACWPFGGEMMRRSGRDAGRGSWAILGAFLGVGRLVVLADPRGRDAGRDEVGPAGRSAAR